MLLGGFLAAFFNSASLEYRKISPGSKERAHDPAQQMENLMDSVELKQLMKRGLDHSVPPVDAIIRREQTIITVASRHEALTTFALI
jgi:hypothetical protein